MRILFATSEAYPLIKTGGLADVSGSLPAALKSMGHDVRLLLPGYPAVLQKLTEQQSIAHVYGLPEIGSAQIILGKIAETGVEVMAIQHHSLYERAGGPYINEHGQDWWDNPLRFGILSHIAARLSCSDSPIREWIPEVLHCNDWQTGLAPAYLHFMQQAKPELHIAKTVISIHNMAFQGAYSPEWVSRLGLPDWSFNINGIEYYGNLSFLKAGIFYATAISTVSPTYAREIQTPEFGFGMQGLLASRSHQIHGILNGIDLNEWNPATDHHLGHSYDIDHLEHKQAVKQALQSNHGLYVDTNAPLFGIVSRLTYQKGLDLFLAIAPQVLRKGAQIILLGGGEAGLESGYKQLAVDYPKQVSVNIGYNEPLSHLVMAGADIFIMPSRFEPCGLNQMYGLRYGTPPIVNQTGGLADSVTDTNNETLANSAATGFVIDDATPEALLNSIERALGYFGDKPTWQSIMKNGMRRELGWEKSASAYVALYEQVLK